MRKQKNTRHIQRGFTIIELLVVVIVIAILASVTVVAFNGVQGRARDIHRVYDITNLRKVLAIYYQLNGTYPAPEQITCGGRDGLTAAMSSTNTYTSFTRDQLSIPLNTIFSPTLETNYATAPGTFCVGLDQCHIPIPLSIWAVTPSGSISSRPTDVYQYCTLKSDGLGGWNQCVNTGMVCDYYALMYNAEVSTPKAIFSASFPMRGYYESPLP